MIQKIKHFFITAGIVIAGLLGVHYNLPETSTIEVNIPNTPPPIVIPINQNKRIEIDCDYTCSKEEKEALPELVAKLTEIEASDCFRDYLLDPKNELDQFQLNGLTVTQAVDIIINSKVHSTLTYFYEPRNWFTKVIVVGFENGDGKIHANRAAWEYMPTCEKISNLAHEISHGPGNGFSHDYKNTSRRPYSMPYEINGAIEACCK